MDKCKSNMQKGFTLVEMLFVIGIIAVILAIGTPIVMNVVEDSKAEEFVSNAKVLEDSISMYYRDNGVMPYVEGSSVSEIEADSRKIVLSKLVEAGVTQPELVLDKLLAEGKLKKIDYSLLKEYTKILKGDEGTVEFIVIDLVEEEQMDESYSVYENDIAGFVFSEGTRAKTTGLVYSGAHSMTKEQSESLEDDIDDLNKVDDSVYEKGMNPYGFRIVEVKDNKNATADLTVSWTNRIVDDRDSLETFKGFVGVDFLIDCSTCEGGSVGTYDINKTDTKYPDYITQRGNTFIMTFKNVPAEKVVMSIKYDKIVYAGRDLTGKETKKAYLNGKADGVDLGEIITGGGDGGGDIPPVCETCGISEIPDGPIEEDKNELYKKLEEVSTFDASNVSAVMEGLQIVGLAKNDIIVLKEYKKVGNLYKKDENRTRVFKLNSETALIPKNPYLQKDFQVNANSDYIYVLEAYKNKLVDNSGAESPENPVEVYYER